MDKSKCIRHPKEGCESTYNFFCGGGGGGIDIFCNDPMRTIYNGFG